VNVIKVIIIFIFLHSLMACVSGAPKLSPEQSIQLESFPVFKMGNPPNKSFDVLSTVSGADCSGAPYGGRVWGDAEKAIDVLKAKAIYENADAVVNVSCGAIPLLNNCWAAQKCSGDAVAYK